MHNYLRNVVTISICLNKMFSKYFSAFLCYIVQCSRQVKQVVNKNRIYELHHESLNNSKHKTRLKEKLKTILDLRRFPSLYLPKCHKQVSL